MLYGPYLLISIMQLFLSKHLLYSKYWAAKKSKNNRSAVISVTSLQNHLSNESSLWKLLASMLFLHCSIMYSSSSSVSISYILGESFSFHFFFLTGNWRINALQHCVDFCYGTMWVSCKYTHVPSLSELPSHMLLNSLQIGFFQH